MKIAHAILSLALALAASTHAGAVDDAIAAGLAAESRMEPREALGHFRAALEARPDDAFLQQKVAQQLSDAAFLEPSPEVRTRLASEALVHAKRAVELDPRSSVARLSLSVLYGKLAIEGDTRTRVDYARRIHLHAEEALSLDESYAWARHVLGRWHVEMSQINMAKRAVVALLYGGMPRASLDEGIAHLEEAVRLEGDAVPHHVELGFAYQRAGRLEEARACWETALQLPSVRVYDSAAKQRASVALGQVGGAG
jgi:tetratricopeptide (TPR) repeat protein